MAPRSTQQTATVRNFGGGWNVADSDLNLASHFQPVSDNILHGADGSFGPRPGYELFADFRDGTETVFTNQSMTIATKNLDAEVTVTWTAHPFSDGDHVTFENLSSQGGISASDFNRTHGVRVTDANTFKFVVRNPALADTSTAVTGINGVRDDHTLAGNIIHGQYFSNKIVVFDDIGEIGTIDDSGNVARIFDNVTAYALADNPAPWRWADIISTSAFRSRLIAVNGYDKDKPLAISDQHVVSYLVDGSTQSNASVPRADYVLSFAGYVIMIRTEYGNARLEFSARNTDGTFSRESDPADAVEIDLSMTTTTVEPIILGGGILRDKVYTAFYDKSMLGEVGNYNSDGDHEPRFDDIIAEHGVISHRTIVGLGNDIIVADYAGVPSVGISVASGTFVPTRVSELISPALQKHLSRMSAPTLRKKAFAVYNPRERQYMLFVPKYDEVAQSLPADAVYFTEYLSPFGYAYIEAPNHNMEEGDSVIIAGATGVSTVDAGDINGTRRVVSVPTEDSLIIEVGDVPPDDFVNGGGSSITLTPVNDETVGYIYTYNNVLKIRRWTRYRQLNFDWGCTSQRGLLFFGKGGKVYSFGVPSNPQYADQVGDYDERTWNTNTLYTVGTRVLDGDTVYICTLEHTSGTGTFADDRTNLGSVWEVYTGKPISWALETPWSDFKERDLVKKVNMVTLDAKGTAPFDVSLFTDNVYRDPTTFELAPSRVMTMVGGDIGGFGIGTNNFGSGRRTREQHLWYMPCRGKLIKARFSGATTTALRIVAFSMLYQVGSIRR